MSHRRVLSLDILRAFAILLMIPGHFLENLAARSSDNAALYDLLYALASLAPVLFTFLVGLSFRLNLARQQQRGCDPAQLRKTVLRRGLCIFNIGLMFAFFVWLPRNLFDWDILTFIGAVTILLIFLHALRPRAFVGIAVACLLVSPFLRMLTNYPASWVSGTYRYDMTLRAIARGFLANGFFPLFPWLAIPFVGYACGTYCFTDNGRRFMRSWKFPAIGLALIAAARGRIYLRALIPPVFDLYSTYATLYPATTVFLLERLGLTLLLWWLCDLIFEQRRLFEGHPALIFFTRYSRFALTAYLVHLAAHLWPSYVIAWLSGKPSLLYYQAYKPLGIPTALALALGFVLVFYGALTLWERRGGRYSFEWLLRWLSE